MNTYEIIKSIICEISGAEDISISDELQRDICLDSLGMVTLLIEIEERFGFEFDESDMNPYDLTTVFDVTELVDKYFDRKL